MYVVAGLREAESPLRFPVTDLAAIISTPTITLLLLNGGSYVGIPKSIRTAAGPICEKFIQDHIALGRDFATETTLRSPIVFDQMKQAHSAGFCGELPLCLCR